MKRAIAVAVAAALALALACTPNEKPLSAPNENVYPLTGKIVSRDAADNTLRIDHEAIPGFMEAMTMDYSVRGASVALLPPNGARVSAKLHVTDSAYWLTDVRAAK